MMSIFTNIHRITDWSIWEHLKLVQPPTPTSASIFSFAEYLAALALFLVVITISDFRYAYRLSLTKTDLRNLGFWVSLTIAVGILLIDVWFQNGLPVPAFASNPNNLKAILGAIFLTFIFRVISVAVVKPPIYGRKNAHQFFYSNYRLIHQGNEDRLQILAEELRASLQAIMVLASRINRAGEKARKDIPDEQVYAHDFLLLLGDERFCKVVVNRVPAFALAFFQEAQKHMDVSLPVFQFARNVGQEFIRNTNSAFYQEDSGYFSGLVGYARPITRIVFGNFEFIEKCASEGESPIDTNYRYDFDPKQMDGYCRAALAFLDSCLTKTKGRWHPHSYALTRMFSSLEGSLIDVGNLSGHEKLSTQPEYARLSTIVTFIKDAITLVDKHAEKPRTFRISEPMRADIYDDLAQLIFKTIFAASRVDSPVWTAWVVQHNTVWNVFGYDRSTANKIIALKVRRLLYDEIKEMDEFANFKGARVLGYCLNVLGLKAVDRHKSYQKEFYPLHAAVLAWTKANYKKLLADHPKVAQVCLQGSVSYDAAKHRLVKTYADEIKREPTREYLELD